MIVCTEIPDDMPLGEVPINDIAVDGYFFKIVNRDARNGQRFAPMVLAHTVTRIPPASNDSITAPKKEAPVVSPATRDIDPTGIWKNDFIGATVSIQRQNAKLVGNWSQSGRNFNIQGATLSGDEIRFYLSRLRRGRIMIMAFVGNVEADSISGYAMFEDEDGKVVKPHWTFRRVR